MTGRDFAYIESRLYGDTSLAEAHERLATMKGGASIAGAAALAEEMMAERVRHGAALRKLRRDLNLLRGKVAG